MLTYILRRILIFIPTLLIITLLGFVISVNAPGDPVERMVSAAEMGGKVYSKSLNQRAQVSFWKKKLGLDLPVFYFSLTSFSKPDTLYKIYDAHEREALDRLCSNYGNWQEIQTYYNSIQLFDATLFESKTAARSVEEEQQLDVLFQLKSETANLKTIATDELIRLQLAKIQGLLLKDSLQYRSKKAFQRVGEAYKKLLSTATPWKNYVPKLVFYSNNQYHRWLFGDGGEFSNGLLRGDLGTSYVTKQPIADVIGSKIGWTLFFSLLSILLAYVISIPLGVKAAEKRLSRFDKTSSLVVFVLYAMPSFWVATLLLMTFANTDVLHWFPASGVKPAGGYSQGIDWWQKLKITAPYIVLPAICYTYSSFAFLSRTMRMSMLEELNQDYIRTARAKGVSNRRILWKHAFKNALFPIITVFGNVFPAAIGGSVILESIFTIPGLGLETLNAIQANNYPMIIAVLTISSTLTLVGFLMSDILYAVVDPRISYKH